MNTREEWARAYHGARIGIQHPPMVRPAGVPRRTWRLAVAAVLRRNRVQAEHDRMYGCAMYWRRGYGLYVPYLTDLQIRLSAASLRYT